MDADLDPLLIAVFCTADDLLPKRAVNARRILTDAEVVTLCVAQHVLRISSDEQFWATAPRRLDTRSRGWLSARRSSSGACACRTRLRR